MYTLRYKTFSYEVAYAVKGPHYIHGYSTDGKIVVSFEGVTDFSSFSYSGTYLTPEKCAEESCNEVKHVNGSLIRSDGERILPSAIGAAPATHSHGYLPLSGGELTGPLHLSGYFYVNDRTCGTSLPSAGNKGRVFLKKV